MPRRSRKAIAVVGITGAAMSAALMLAPPAAAGDFTTMAEPCDGWVGTTISVSNVSKPKKLTHASRYYNGTTSNATASRTASRQLTLTAGITVSSGVSVEGGPVVAKLGATAGVSVAASGSATTSSSISFTATIKPRQSVVIYQGRVKVTGKYKVRKCTSGSGTMRVTTGTARSYRTVLETGAAACNVTQPSGSYAALAKNNYC
ncbi:hypothetical protein [Streptomyces sp. UG1]|uniref:hypothetical protein n=1 Tax=Streptomyces sp. UG1 TaxID=3417652 RepID=UPI003CF561AA